MSWGTVMIAQPDSCAWKMFSTSRVLAQSSSALGWPYNRAPHARSNGIGSTPVSAMRPAKTETTDGTAGFSASATSATCVSVSRAVTFNFTPAWPSSRMSGRHESPREFVIGILV